MIYGAFFYYFENPFFITQILRIGLIALLIGLIIFCVEIHSGFFYGWGKVKSLVRWCILLPLFIVVILLALAGLSRTKTDVLSEELRGKVLLGIDNSASQGADDIPDHLKTVLRGEKLLPTRMTLCTEVFIRMLEGVRGLEVSLVTFTEATNFRTGEWIRLNPNSRGSFFNILRGLRPLWIGSGTNLYRFFLEIKEGFKDEVDIVMLCSDGGKGATGESNNDTLLRVKSFSRQGKIVPVYVLGSGGRGKGWTPIPDFAPDGSRLGYLKEPGRDKIARTEFDEEILRAIAKVGQGEYLYLDSFTAGRELLQRAVFSSIKQGAVKVESVEDLTSWVVGFAVILFVLLFRGFFRFKKLS